MKYIFANKSKFEEPIRVLFLCGSSFSGTKHDKRIILKDYLEQQTENKVILLEKYFNFNFRVSKKDILSYYNFGLHNLYNIEMLASLVANKIIILHESFSTAGEIGVFASNNFLRDKIITLIPERYSIEEEKFSSFLKLAFWNNREKLINNNIIRYYPITKEIYVSEHRSIYHTYFPEDKIPKTVGDLLNQQIGQKSILNVALKYKQFDSFYFNVNMEFDTLKNYIISLLTIPDFRNQLYKCKSFSELKKLFKTTFETILKNTIKERTNVYPTKLNITLNKQHEFKLANCINFMILTLHSCGFINIICEDDNTISVHRVKGTMPIIKKYSSLIKKIEPMEWGK